MEFIELMDDENKPNLFNIDLIARVYVGEINNELVIQFAPGSFTPIFRTRNETLETLRKKLKGE